MSFYILNAHDNLTVKNLFLVSASVFILYFCNSFVPDFESLHNLMHLNDVCDTNTIFDDSGICDSKSSKSCKTTPLSNIQGNEAEMCDSHLKNKFVSNNVINLSMQNLTECDISLLS